MNDQYCSLTTIVGTKVLFTRTSGSIWSYQAAAKGICVRIASSYSGCQVIAQLELLSNVVFGIVHESCMTKRCAIHNRVSVAVVTTRRFVCVAAVNNFTIADPAVAHLVIAVVVAFVVAPSKVDMAMTRGDEGLIGRKISEVWDACRYLTIS
jgi:hypothetical protein